MIKVKYDRKLIYLEKLILNVLNIFFADARDTNDLMAKAAYLRDRVNPQLFAYALGVAIMHRPDTQDLRLPLNVEIFPDKFFDADIIEKAKSLCNILEPTDRVSEKNITFDIKQLAKLLLKTH